jgi:anti-sigma regulatory factor (Ser/Thr protein kinase)
MVAEPESVPAVRRFVDDVLTEWGRRNLAEDVGLSVTELATNATLHSRAAHFDVELHGDAEAIRLAVVDTGATAAQAIASRTSSPSVADEDLAWESMTGRGLFIVSALATRWGIEDLPGGTRIWAEFSTRGSDYEPREPIVDSRCDRVATAPAGATTVIRLLGCPAALLLAHDDNLADIARELRLFGASHAERSAVAAAEEIVEVVRASAISWDAARLQAQQSLAEGRDTVDIAIAVSDAEQLPGRIAALRRAVGMAESMSEKGLLITMAAPAPVQEWRDWVEAEMLQQTASARTPVPFADFRG